MSAGFALTYLRRAQGRREMITEGSSAAISSLIAASVAEKSAVLLKNRGNVLPISRQQSVAVIGDFAKDPRYQGAGSSLIKPTKITDAFEGLIKEGYSLNFAPGYNKKKDEILHVQDLRNI
jgi:beta-glucosidase-like glycosyl hydrolase